MANCVATFNPNTLANISYVDRGQAALQIPKMKHRIYTVIVWILVGAIALILLMWMMNKIWLWIKEKKVRRELMLLNKEDQNYKIIVD